MRYLILAALIALSGCAEWQAIKQGVAEYGAQAADESVIVGRWKHCNAESVGAIKRIYNTPDKMEKYNQFCNMVNDVKIDPPVLENPDDESNRI